MPASSGSKRAGGADGTLALLWRLVQAVLDDGEPALEGLGLSPKAFYLLEAVADHPFPAELARRMHLPPPTVTYLVKQLEARGFVERRSEAGDLRRFRLTQTPEGRKALKQGRDALAAVFEGRMKRLDPAEAVVLDDLVARLAAPAESGEGVL